MCNELAHGQVFRCNDGSVVKLDRQVPGDGTKWHALDWWNGSWSSQDGTVEPGDLVERLTDREST